MYDPQDPLKSINTINTLTSKLKDYYINSYLLDVQVLRIHLNVVMTVSDLPSLRQMELTELRQLSNGVRSIVSQKAYNVIKAARDELRAQRLASQPTYVRTLSTPGGMQ